MAATRTPQPGPNTPLSTQTRGGSFLLLFLEPNTAKAGSLRARPPGSFVRPAILARSAAKPAGRLATSAGRGQPPAGQQTRRSSRIPTRTPEPHLLYPPLTARSPAAGAPRPPATTTTATRRPAPRPPAPTSRPL